MNRAFASIGLLCLVVSTLVGCTSQPDISSVFVEQLPETTLELTRQAVLDQQEVLQQDPENAVAQLGLAQLYLQVVRETADASYYDHAETLLRAVEHHNPDEAEVTFLRAIIAVGRHEFAQALDLIHPLIAAQPAVAKHYSVQVDALIELGRYDEAEVALQIMLDLEPSFAALTRVAYLREITGDLEGAVMIMEEALSGYAALPEHRAWGLTELARVTEPLSRDHARQYLEAVRTEYPTFVPATTALAELELREGNIETARQLLEEALKIQPLPAAAILLGESYALEGDDSMASTYYKLAEAAYDQSSRQGTNVDLERADLLINQRRNPAAGLKLAQKIYDERPTIYAADLVSWALYQQGEFEEALKYIEEAQRTGADMPSTLFHAGMINAALDRNDIARQFLERALEREAQLSVLDAALARETLQKLE